MIMKDIDLELFEELDKEFEQRPAGVSLKRGALVLQIGCIYRHKHNQTEYLLHEMMDVNRGLFRNLSTNKLEQLFISDIEASTSINIGDDINEISDTDWQIAQERLAAIKPFVIQDTREEKVTYAQRSLELNIPERTLKRWAARYKDNPHITSLIDKQRGWRLGNRRLLDTQEAIIKHFLETYYLSPLKPDVSSTIRYIRNECLKQGVKPPSGNTIRLSIERMDFATKLKGRGMSKRAKALYTPKAGNFPETQFPLEVVQIDHTPMDIILVDEIHRKPIGRPYLTLAVDVYSRMITGYYLSFDAPSATSVGMCLVQSILPKDKVLAKFDIDAKWPVLGYPRKIHVDNGADFRSITLEKSCSLHGIPIEFRPLARPEYGGHIERLIGSVMKEVHRLEGTTFSNIFEKGEYNAEKRANMTLFELEKWLVTFITKVYHQRVHSGIDMTPLRRWEIGIFGDEQNPGLGMPALPNDEQTLVIDFLPYFERTIQATGVTLNNIRYYDPVLNNFINTVDSTNASSNDDSKGLQKQKFIFRQDPRDISCLWFFDPITKKYFQIPYANQALPRMSLWEFKHLKQISKAKNGTNDEHSLLMAYEEMQKVVQKASMTTKKARRQQARSKHHQSMMDYKAPQEFNPSPSSSMDNGIKIASTSDALKNNADNTSWYDDNYDDYFDEIE